MRLPCHFVYREASAMPKTVASDGVSLITCWPGSTVTRAVGLPVYLVVLTLVARLTAPAYLAGGLHGGPICASPFLVAESA